MRLRIGIFVSAIPLILAGCATTHPMMPTPVLYAGTQPKPLFAVAPAGSESPTLDLLFVTDRAPAKDGDGDVPYTAGRARFIAFGSTTVKFGDHLGWEELVKESTATERTVPLNLSLGSTKELGRFPRIPYELTVGPEGISRLPAVVEAHEKMKAELQAEIARRLDAARRKEVVLFVHGYHDSFEAAAMTMGELCHFLGRDFVCAIFSWPAGGRRGLLFGYNEDRESGEYAVEDLLKTIRIVAGVPGVQRIHLLAHSRGTDILATALAELSVEAYALGETLAHQFKIGNVILVAPDIDADVALAKIFKVFSDPDLPFNGRANPGVALKPSPEFKVTIYASPNDKALATSGWIFGSLARLGRIDATMFTAHQIDEIRTFGAVDVIQVRATTDPFGHSYFVSNPEVSADIIAMLRYRLQPNEPGRLLNEVVRPFWRVPTREDKRVPGGAWGPERPGSEAGAPRSGATALR
jgi:esterase/lipase superfamily enzyme